MLVFYSSARPLFKINVRFDNNVRLLFKIHVRFYSSVHPLFKNKHALEDADWLCRRVGDNARMLGRNYEDS